MSSSVLAAQMYTLREFTKTPADIARSLKKVKQIGYDAIQSSAFGPIDPKELAKILQGEGLACCATHISLDRMENDTQAVIEEHKLWGCEYTALGGFKGTSTQEWLDFAEKFNSVAKKFEGSGISLGYHNHSHEYAHYDGKPAIQILLEKLSPRIWFEIDTYWVAHGGAEPSDWIRRCSGRIPCVHLKDMGITADRKQFMMEVGEGNLNWPGILKACKESGVKWYIIEQDHCQRDPFESLAISLRNLKEMGLN